MKTLEELARECVQGIIDTSYPGKEVFVQNSVKLKILDALKQVRDQALEEAEKVVKSETAKQSVVEENPWALGWAACICKEIRALREKDGE
jgi:hypothetical protein